ncbi:hypothetical protein CCHL11_06650 [Colletotrichum chlorophyti]|uniref:Uncharacterized protein n=1 Tax=Colletotrichum chlorophyti TaxID=708187 RepID=A0A1Q8RXM2_9PEZI|nr:hypothetical protein CCHL11_06650 [Colletotrichum chlorophyti]
MCISSVTFAQFRGSSVSLAVGNAVFASASREELPQFAPNVDPRAVTEAGATGFRKVVPKSELSSVLRAYVKCIEKEFMVSLGFAAASFCFAWGMGWKDIRSKDPGKN